MKHSAYRRELWSLLDNEKYSQKLTDSDLAVMLGLKGNSFISQMRSAKAPMSLQHVVSLAKAMQLNDNLRHRLYTLWLRAELESVGESFSLHGEAAPDLDILTHLVRSQSAQMTDSLIAAISSLYTKSNVLSMAAEPASEYHAVGIPPPERIPIPPPHIPNPPPPRKG